jgi:PAS domain S-box-containing protein
MSPEAVPEAGDNPLAFPRLCRYFTERSPQPAVAVEGATHVIRYLNPAFARLSGKDAAALVGRPFAEAVPEGEGNGCLALLDRVFHTGVPEELVEQEHRQAHPQPVYWSYSMWAILGADERPVGVMIQVTDVSETAAYRARAVAMNEALVLSAVRQHELIDAIREGERERHELEVRLFQAQKLESLGVLAGGLAHDLNNMLTPVLGYVELAADGLPADSPAAPMLELVSAHAHRAADLVQQILAYAGKGRFVIQPINLSDLVRETIGLLAAAVSTGTTLDYELAPALPAVEADATQLRQVVLNLVSNASEALGGGGTVTVRTGSMPAAPHAPQSPSLPTDHLDGPTVFLEVSDTGHGMTAEQLGKIFDPFYTTKFTGRGLGLAVVQGIARGHGGSVQVRSEPGHGSTFRLVLPCSSAVPPTPAAPARPERWRGTGTVLVIDDEPGVRDLAALILRRAGLTVLIAANGLDGLAVFRDHGPGIDAVVLDLNMPQMGGLEAAQAVRGLQPNLPVVLMSGYSAEEVSAQSSALGPAGFVQKPFTAPSLLAAVRLALGQ